MCPDDKAQAYDGVGDANSALPPGMTEKAPGPDGEPLCAATTAALLSDELDFNPHFLSCDNGTTVYSVLLNPRNYYSNNLATQYRLILKKDSDKCVLTNWTITK